MAKNKFSAKLRNNVSIIPMTKFEYKNMVKGVTHSEYKWEHGFYIQDFNIWISDIEFDKLFIIDET